MSPWELALPLLASHSVGRRSRPNNLSTVSHFQTTSAQRGSDVLYILHTTNPGPHKQRLIKSRLQCYICMSHVCRPIANRGPSKGTHGALLLEAVGRWTHIFSWGSGVY